MAQLMMVNPRKRSGRKRRTPAQVRATKKLVASNRRQKNPATRRRSPVRSVTRRYKRNPARNAQGIINQQLMPAATNASGALALDIIWGFLPIPVNIKAGPMKHIAKGAGAIALGMVAKNVVNAATAKALSQGALTVVMHDAMREIAQRMMPNVPLGYYSAGTPMGVGEYMPGLGAYIGGEGSSPYLSADMLSKPFAGPSPADTAKADLNRCLENEDNMGCYY